MSEEIVPDPITKAIQAGNFKLALKKILVALGKEPDNVGLLLDLGGVYTNLQKTDKAISSYQKVIKLAPKSASGFAGLGFAYHVKEDFDNAIASFQKAIKLAPENPFVHIELGDIYFEINQLQDALKCYKDALELSSEENKPEILHRLADLHLELNDPDQTISYGKDLLKIDDKMISIYLIMAEAAKMKKNNKSALEFYEKYLQKAPEDEEIQALAKELKK
ncbi:MAG: tetratricopeptide repeat protein [Promethearchaeota archaeon]